jgi:hypothetical protein
MISTLRWRPFNPSARRVTSSRPVAVLAYTMSGKAGMRRGDSMDMAWPAEAEK